MPAKFHSELDPTQLADASELARRRIPSLPSTMITDLDGVVRRVPTLFLPRHVDLLFVRACKSRTLVAQQSFRSQQATLEVLARVNNTFACLTVAFASGLKLPRASAAEHEVSRASMLGIVPLVSFGTWTLGFFKRGLACLDGDFERQLLQIRARHLFTKQQVPRPYGFWAPWAMTSCTLRVQVWARLCISTSCSFRNLCKALFIYVWLVPALAGFRVIWSKNLGTVPHQQSC